MKCDKRPLSQVKELTTSRDLNCPCATWELWKYLNPWHLSFTIWRSSNHYLEDIPKVNYIPIRIAYNHTSYSQKHISLQISFFNIPNSHFQYTNCSIFLDGHDGKRDWSYARVDHLSNIWNLTCILRFTSPHCP